MRGNSLSPLPGTPSLSLPLTHHHGDLLMSLAPPPKALGWQLPFSHSLSPINTENAQSVFCSGNFSNQVPLVYPVRSSLNRRLPGHVTSTCPTRGSQTQPFRTMPATVRLLLPLSMILTGRHFHIWTCDASSLIWKRWLISCKTPPP